MQTSEHEWRERAEMVREARGVPVFGLVLEPAWDQCTRCGVSRDMAEHRGWRDCRPTEGGESDA